jgi:hypothetical protein
MGKNIKTCNNESIITIEDNNQLNIDNFYLLEVSNSENLKIIDKYEVTSETQSTEYTIYRILQGPKNSCGEIVMGMGNFLTNLN